MTQEQFDILSRYEDNLRTAMTRKWARHPGTTAVKTIYGILTELTGPRPRLNALCQSCVLATLADAGKLYFAEKERREKAQTERQAREKEVEAKLKATREAAETDAPKVAKETAKEADSKPVKPKAKKVSTKKPKASKTEK